MILKNFKYINNIVIICFIIIILLLIFKYYVKNIESFQNFEDLKNYKDISCLNDIIKDKNISVLGSGKSLNYFKKTNDIGIAVNNSINHDIIPSFNKIIWMLSTLGGDTKYNYYTNIILPKLKKKPDIIVLYMFENHKKMHEKFYKFAKYIHKRYPKIILSKYYIAKKHSKLLSSGYYSIKLSLKYNPKNVIIAGLDAVNGSNEYVEDMVAKKNGIRIKKKPVHNYVDKKYINNLNKKDKSKLKPIKECGLYEYLKLNP